MSKRTHPVAQLRALANFKKFDQFFDHLISDMAEMKIELLKDLVLNMPPNREAMIYCFTFVKVAHKKKIESIHDLKRMDLAEKLEFSADYFDALELEIGNAN